MALYGLVTRLLSLLSSVSKAWEYSCISVSLSEHFLSLLRFILLLYYCVLYEHVSRVRAWPYSRRIQIDHVKMVDDTDVK